MFERCLYFNLNAITRSINQIWGEAFRPLGLSPSHAYLLRLVLEQSGMSPKQIAAELNLAPSTVTRFVDTLIQKGFLERGSSKRQDRRESAIYPLEKAKALQQQLEATGQQLFQHMRSTLGEETFTHLVTELRHNKQIIDKERKDETL